jgi:hypothetical protein
MSLELFASFEAYLLQSLNSLTLAFNNVFFKDTLTLRSAKLLRDTVKLNLFDELLFNSG